MLRGMRLATILIGASSALVLGCGSDDSGGGSPPPDIEYPTETLVDLAGFDASGPAPFGIATDGSNVYVSVFAGSGDTGAIFRAPKTGGTPEALAPAGSSRALALHDGLLFYDNVDAGAIQTVPADGGDVTDLTTESPATEIAVSGNTLVFAHSVIDGTSLVATVDKSGGELTTLLETDERPSAVAIDGDTAYVALLGPGNSAASEGTIVSVPIAGGETTRVASFLAGPRALVVQGGMLYATLQGEGPANGEVIAVTLPTGPTKILANRLAKPWGIAADDTHLYWVNRGSGQGDGTVMRMSKEGGYWAILADEQGEPRQIVVDDTHVYWTNYRSGEVMRVEKVELDAR